MNTLVWSGILVAIAFAATGSASKVSIAEVGSKTFYTIEGKDAATWSEAIDACGSEGLSMAVIENKAESRALSAYLREKTSSGLMWLGAYLKDGKWIWASNGEELTYKNWARDAVLNDPGDSPTNGYGCGFINGGPKWGTWACGAGNAIVACQ